MSDRDRDTTPDPGREPRRTAERAAPWRRTLLICLGILAAGALLVTIVFLTEPVAKRTAATRRTPMLVDVVTVHRDDHRPVITAMGTVVAEQDVVLRPRVRGEVVARAAAFTPGGVVARGDTLLRLDPADYENALQQRRGDLARARADQALEEGRRTVAELDYAVLGETDAAVTDSALVLRRPQREAARARVAAAAAAVRRAELELARTAVTAPFAAQVISREVNVGSQVEAGDVLGRLAGLDEYWVEVALPRDRLRWLDFPDDPGGRGAPVTIRDRTAWPEGAVRRGRLATRIGALDARTRLARVLVAVPDPLALQPRTEGPPLVIGAYVEARIEARELADVVRLDRDLVRQGGTVWVMEGDSLRIRDVEILVSDAAHAYVAAGLADGDRVVTTNLTTVADGAPLRLAGGDAGGDTGGARRDD